MATSNLESLRSAVVGASVGNTWGTAVLEWEVTGLEESPTGTGICVCGQPNLVHLFTITNRVNGEVLFPIGSVCVHKFEVEDLSVEVSVLPDLFAIRNAVRSGVTVELNSDFFSRALLEYMYLNGAFWPDQWNYGDGANDYSFLLKMFNKRMKNDITSKQHWKISALLREKVIPFIEADDRLR